MFPNPLYDTDSLSYFSGNIYLKLFVELYFKYVSMPHIHSFPVMELIYKYRL